MSTERYCYLVSPLAYTGQADSFTYHYDGELPVGSVVTIPLGRRSSLGVVLSRQAAPEFRTKAITSPVDVPPVPTYLLELGAWIAAYYASSLSGVWSAFLPTGLTKNRRAQATPVETAAKGLPVAPLTDEQAAALQQIRASDKRTTLLHGVTGSGKTRLYLELAAEALAAGQSVIVLVPEITLTPQVIGQFEEAFGPVVISTHSKLTEAQRHLVWSQATEATAARQPRIVVGPRSSLFLPLHQVGLIIIDECHETSYKQEQNPRYHAVTAAAQLAKLTGARLILGSATPSLQEVALARSGRTELVQLTRRANAQPAPEATIIDLRQKDLLGTSKFLSQPLLDALTATLAEGRQSLLYLNRRGSASSQVCGDCGEVTLCPNCRLPLTFHADLMRLVCHHCNYRQTSPAVCPVCGGANLKLLGGGTKRIEAEIEKLFPEARLARLDRDSATIGHIKAVFKGLRQGDIDIVIGTQMIAKGLDLPAIDTVGVVSADTMLHLPDFGAAERTYQLLSQVSGRAGRGDRPGRVFIQTYTPDHPAIVAAAAGSFDQFAAAELEQRQALSYPPFCYLLKLSYGGKSQDDATTETSRLVDQLRRQDGLGVMGPAPAFIENQSGRWVWVVTVKAKTRAPLVQIARALPSDTWSADLDPVNLL